MAFHKPRNFKSHDSKESADLVQMALAQMWPVPEDRKQEILQQQLDIIRDPLVPTHTRLLACKNVLAMGALNLKAVDVLIKASGINTGDQSQEQIDWDALTQTPSANKTEARLLQLMPEPKENGSATNGVA